MWALLLQIYYYIPPHVTYPILTVVYYYHPLWDYQAWSSSCSNELPAYPFPPSPSFPSGGWNKLFIQPCFFNYLHIKQILALHYKVFKRLMTAVPSDWLSNDYFIRNTPKISVERRRRGTHWGDAKPQGGSISWIGNRNKDVVPWRGTANLRNREWVIRPSCRAEAGDYFSRWC